MNKQPTKQAPAKPPTPAWKLYAPLAAAVLVMLFTGWKQGVWSERWGTSPHLQLFAKQLLEVPTEFGEWKGVDATGSTEEVLKLAGAEGELVRTYRNAANEEVRVSIICARLQDIFHHTPDRCYPAAGFEMQADPQKMVFEIPSRPEFFTTTFLKTEPTGVHSERGYWSWSGDGAWVAPDNHKLRFAGQQWALYKLYVFAPTPQGRTKSTDRDFCKEFIEAFVPVLETSLRPVFVETGRIEPDATLDEPPASAPGAAKPAA